MARLDPTRALRVLVPETGDQRAYGLATFINTIGFGMYLPSVVLYFTKVLDLSAVQVGVGLTIAGMVALLAAVPAGDLADRHGPREVVRWTMILQALASFAYLLIHGFPAFVLLATAEALATTANIAATGALRRRVGGERAVTYRSTILAIANLGISVGALAAAISIQIGTPTAYRALLLLNGLSSLVAFAILGRLPRYAPLPKPHEGPRWAALADRPYVAYTALTGALVMQGVVIQLPLPLWVVNHTDAPRWSVSLFLIVNTVVVILMQVRVGRHIQTIRQGGVAMRRSGALLLVSCSAIGLAAGLPAWVAFVMLVGAVVVHTFAEIWYSSGTFALEIGMAPEHAQGQYQGLTGIGTGIGTAVAPVLLVGLLLSLGKAGWIGLGACFLLLGLAAPALARWGERTRGDVTVPAEAAPALISD
ncbi:MAG: MFS transporter [Frankiaceae bacterium]